MAHGRVKFRLTCAAVVETPLNEPYNLPSWIRQLRIVWVTEGGAR
jgi:hypothetical protein